MCIIICSSRNLPTGMNGKKEKENFHVVKVISCIENKNSTEKLPAIFIFFFLLSRKKKKTRENIGNFSHKRCRMKRKKKCFSNMLQWPISHRVIIMRFFLLSFLSLNFLFNKWMNIFWNFHKEIESRDYLLIFHFSFGVKFRFHVFFSFFSSFPLW